EGQVHAPETPLPETGTQPPGGRTERGATAQGGVVPSGREASSLPRGGGRTPDLSLAFQRQPPAINAARLTPDVRAELARIVAEKRAAGDWQGLSAPWLPPLKPRAVIHEPDLDAAIEREIAEPSDSVEPEGAADASFNPADYERPTADVLDTGEAQGRLPGAES